MKINIFMVVEIPYTKYGSMMETNNGIARCASQDASISTYSKDEFTGIVSFERQKLTRGQ